MIMVWKERSFHSTLSTWRCSPVRCSLWSTIMLTCPSCHHPLPDDARFCTKCGWKISQGLQNSPSHEILNLRILYLMAALLILAVLFPPWESAPGEPPEYLGFHFILDPPRSGAVVSRILQTIELVTIALTGMYGAWFFRRRGR